MKSYWEQVWKRKHTHNGYVRMYHTSEHIMGISYYACDYCKIMICMACMKESPVSDRESHLKCFSEREKRI